MHCNKVSLQLQALLDCFSNDLDIGNNAWYLEHNVGKLQEILNRIMQKLWGLLPQAYAEAYLAIVMI